MSGIAIESLVLFLLILTNGLFAMSEIAIVSARKTLLQRQAEEGNSRARIALDLANAPNKFLATTQIGITLVGVLAGAFGGATIGEELAVVLRRIPFLVPYADAAGVALVVLVTTYLSLVIGELAPKRLGLNNAERVAAAIAPAMQFLSRLASPIVRLLSISTELVLRLLGAEPTVEAPVTEDEITIMIKQGTEVGVFEPGEQQMVEQVFRLADEPISALMTPRPNVIWFNAADPEIEILRTVTGEGHSRYPVARNDLDQAIGLVYAKDLLVQCLSGQPIDFQAAVRQATFLPESITALEAVERLKETRSDAALVIDEYGGFQGILTVNDILEAIVGEISLPEEPAEPEAVQREDGSWLLDGMLPVDELREILDLGELPYEGKAHYQTVSGLVMYCLGRVPTEGDHFRCCGWQFEVVDMDARRVDKVLASQVPDTETQPT